LLDMLLGGHSSIASLGEFSYLGKAIALDQACSCGEPVSRCSEWERVFRLVELEKGVSLKHHPYALRQWDTRARVIIDRRQQTNAYRAACKIRRVLSDIRFRLPAQSPFRVPLSPSLRRGVENTICLYEIVRKEWGRSVVVDSSKNVHKALAVYEASPEDTRIVLLTRDGRGVYWSYRRSGFSRAESVAGWAGYYRRAVPFLNRTIAQDHLIRVRYEDLMRDTHGTLASISRFLGLTFEPTMTDLSNPVRHLFNGNDTRFARDRPIALDERWTREMGEDELQYFQSRGSRLNSQLGYA
jgi:Sulfotransferase family